MPGAAGCRTLVGMNLDQFRIVLTRPLYSGNVGAVCRAMKNMGFSDLAIVTPTLGLPELELRKMALHAISVYEGHRPFATLADAVADCPVVAGTTARAGIYREHAHTLRDAAPELAAASVSGRVALVFGPEDNGLSNEEIALCTRLIQIPSTDAYRSINLAQAVMLVCYEFFIAADTFEPIAERSGEATSGQREQLYIMWRKMLLDTGFMHDQTADHMMQGVRRIFSRGALTDNDIRILMGVARQAQWCADQVDKTKSADP